MRPTGAGFWLSRWRLEVCSTIGRGSGPLPVTRLPSTPATRSRQDAACTVRGRRVAGNGKQMTARAARTTPRLPTLASRPSRLWEGLPAPTGLGNRGWKPLYIRGGCPIGAGRPSHKARLQVAAHGLQQPARRPSPLPSRGRLPVSPAIHLPQPVPATGLASRPRRDQAPCPFVDGLYTTVRAWRGDPPFHDASAWGTGKNAPWTFLCIERRPGRRKGRADGSREWGHVGRKRRCAPREARGYTAVPRGRRRRPV